MTREKHVPESKQDWLNLRAGDITSTEIAALFGISPYMTKFELWHRKRARQVVELDENDRMKWGTRLQDAIAAGIAADTHWTVKRKDEYMRIPELRIGSSFDFEGHSFLLEIKNVDGLVYRNQWENDEAPPHIELQVQHQMLVSGHDRAYIGALVGGNAVTLIARDRDDTIFDAIKFQARMFWESIDAGTPPEPDFERDAEFISQLYKQSSPGKVLDAGADLVVQNLATQYRDLGEQIKQLESSRKGVRAQILTHIGDAEKAVSDQFTISARTVAATQVEAFERKAYRDLRITWKKENAK